MGKHPVIEKVVIGTATLYCGDSMQVMRELDLQVDAVITDPPYSSGGFTRGDRTADTKTKYMQSDSGNQTRLQDFTGDNRDQRGFHFWSALWSSAAMALTKTGGVACFFTDWRQLPISTDYMQAGGWIWRGCVPWVKSAYRPQMGRFGAQCEYVVWGSNGPMPTDRGVGCLPGWFEHMAPQDRVHITQKPVELMTEIVAIVPPDALVLDPFMGSGTTGVACAMTGRRFIGIEQSQHHFESACRRIEQAALQRDLLGHKSVPVMQQTEIDA